MLKILCKFYNINYNHCAQKLYVGAKALTLFEPVYGAVSGGKINMSWLTISKRLNNYFCYWWILPVREASYIYENNFPKESH